MNEGNPGPTGKDGHVLPCKEVLALGRVHRIHQSTTGASRVELGHGGFRHLACHGVTGKAYRTLKLQSIN